MMNNIIQFQRSFLPYFTKNSTLDRCYEQRGHYQF